MLTEDLIADANRQFTICNACRYCEGLCSVFPAMELRTAFTQGDLSYLSALCHDCRACIDACPFSPPHELDVDIPELMAAARLQTFERYARPRLLWRLLTRPLSIAVVVALTLVLFTIVATSTGDPSRIIRGDHGRESFYHVVSFLWLVIPAGIVSAFAVAAITAGAFAFVRETGGASRLLNPRTLIRATSDALALRNLRGGGGGCRYPGDTRSPIRRHLHNAVFYGFVSMFAATVAAALEQDILGIQPPYPLLSVPVALGTLGGVATIAGCIGFVTLGVRSRDVRKSDQTRSLDRTFTVILAASVVTGLLTLVLRGTPAMGPALILHLGVLGGLYVAFPYSKFVHWVYRYLALLRSSAERTSRPVVHGPAGERPSPELIGSPALVQAERADA